MALEAARSHRHTGTSTPVTLGNAWSVRWDSAGHRVTLKKDWGDWGDVCSRFFQGLGCPEESQDGSLPSGQRPCGAPPLEIKGLDTSALDSRSPGAHPSPGRGR